MLILALLLPTLVAPSPSAQASHSAVRAPSGVRPLARALPACAETVQAGQYAGALALWTHPQLLACSAGSAGPYGASVSPDGSSLYVALFGSGFGSEGCRVARFDAHTLQLDGWVPTGLGPVEVACSGPLGFVADSSGSSVTVFATPSLAVLATIAIPPTPGSGWSTAFPSALALSPDGARLYVGTNDGGGLVHAIDTGTLTRLPAETIALGRGRTCGRMLFAGEQLVVPVARFHPGFAGSTAEVIFLDPRAPLGRRITTLATSPDASAFPSPLDAALWCDAELFVAGFDMGRRLFVLDPASGALEAQIDLPTSGENGSYQALALSPRGLVAVSELLTNELAWVDASSRSVLGVQALGALPDFHTQLAELVVLPDGDLVATGQFSDSLAVFALP